MPGTGSIAILIVTPPATFIMPAAAFLAASRAASLLIPRALKPLAIPAAILLSMPL